jgi:hypothetical protein
MCQSIKSRLRILHFHHFIKRCFIRPIFFKLDNLIGIFFCILEIIFENFNRLTRLSHFHKWSDVNVIGVELNNIVRSVHVDEQILLLKFYVLVQSSVIAKRSFTSPEMTPKNYKLIALCWFRT